MNQVLKDRIYGMGTQKQVDFMAELGGMNEEEKRLMNLLHEKRTDEYIQDIMSIDRKTYSRIMESVSSKLLLAVFECINFTREHKA